MSCRECRRTHRSTTYAAICAIRQPIKPGGEPQFSGIAHNHAASEAGDAPEQGQVEAAVDGITSTVGRVATLIEALEPEKKSSLSTAVGKVQGSFSSFGQSIRELAVQRKINVSIKTLTEKVSGLSKDMNPALVTAETMNPTKKPTLPIEDALKASVSKHVISLEIDVTSVEAGNWEDVHKVNLHATSLADLSEMKGVDLKSHLDHLISLSSRIDRLAGRANDRLMNAKAAMKRIFSKQ